MPDTPALSVRCNAAIGVLRLDVLFTLVQPWSVLFGVSGSGKSSILRLVAGLWRPNDAAVELDGRNLTDTPSHLRRIGLVAHQPALFPHLDVLDNIRFGCTGDPRCVEFVPQVIDLLSLEHLQHAAVTQLSGGERQRVALARALAANPRLLLLDEVFTGMHREQRNQLLERIHTHCQRYGIAVLSVTHDVAEALACADEVVRLANGRIIAQGSPSDVLVEERAALMSQLG